MVEQVLAQVKNILNLQVKEENWLNHARAEQIPPKDNWHTWVILAGRGFGKTRTGAETVKLLVDQGYKRIGLIGKTIQDVRNIMINGISGLCSIYQDQSPPKYYASQNRLVWPNGAIAHAFGGDNPSSLRGPQFDLVWIDEFAKFYNPTEVLNQIRMCLRIGNPKLIITTTPTAHPCIKRLINDPSIHVTRGSTLDNRDNLAKEYIESIQKEFAGSTFGLQEIYGQVLSEDQHVFWTEENILYQKACQSFDQIVIGVDPAVTNNQRSDETGIIVVGKHEEKFYVLADRSLKSNPVTWVQVIVDTYYEYNVDCVVVEINQGGNIVTELIKQIDNNVQVHEVRAVHNKYIRAQPVSIMYQQGKVLHTDRFLELEEQLCTFSTSNSSPDRVDALVWAITYLKAQNCPKVL